MSRFRRFFRFMSGKPAEANAEPWLESEYPTDQSIDPLFQRLDREYQNQERDIRGIQTEDISSKLFDEIIGLMFDLSPERDDWTSNWLIDVLRQQTMPGQQTMLEIRRRIFYIYLDENAAIRSGTALAKDLYSRLVTLAEHAEPLYHFINAIYIAKLSKIRNIDPSNCEPFDVKDAEHCGALPYFLPCHISVCRKKFPQNARSQIFIVGRAPIHDVFDLQRREDELAAIARRITEHQISSEVDPIVKVAATIRTSGLQDGSRVIFNAHTFGPQDARPRLEGVLYIGDWPPDRELSIGSAEHDDFQCFALKSISSRAVLTNIGWRQRHWDFDFRAPTGLPKWFNCEKGADFEPNFEGVQVRIKPDLAANMRVLDRLGQAEFVPELRLTARVLPTSGGQLVEISDITESDFHSAIATLSRITAAIEVYKNAFWLLRTEDGGIVQVNKSGGRWVQSAVRDGEPFTFGDFSYFWKGATESILPSRFCGILYIRPSDEQKSRFTRSLAVDQEADAMAIAHGSPFSPDIHPDALLGRYGVVCLKSVEPRFSKPAYKLDPVKDALHPFFAFNPSIRPPNSPAGWITYGEGSTTPELIAVGANNYLICGTSFFHIKTSATPNMSMVGNLPALGTTGVSETRAIAVVPRHPSNFDPANPADVKIRLIGTMWSGYEIGYISKSNIAVHYGLRNDVGDKRFLKAYYAKSVDNAVREADFYALYQDSASRLFLAAPDVLRADETNPWALVFPRLQPLEDALPILTLPQAAAIGYGMCTLLRALDQDRLINFDIHSSMFCLDDNGRLVVVDFDNVFPLLRASPNALEIAAVRDILQGGELPTSNLLLPPEALAFRAAQDIIGRQNALAKIGAPFCVYMLAAVMVELLGMSESTQTEGGWHRLTLRGALFEERSRTENSSVQAAGKLAVLLQSMLEKEVSSRPMIADVMVQLRAIVATFANSSEDAAKDVSKLLGGVPQEERPS